MRPIALLALALVACSSSSVAVTPTPSPSPSPFVGGSPTSAAVRMAGGCGITQVYKGGQPDWLIQAGDNNNPTDLPYFITDPPNAAGFIFGYPLHSQATNSTVGNKILWVVGIPRNEADLTVSGHPQGASAPILHMAFPANSSPGEIYPSEVDVPTPGCWHFDLSWGPNTTAVDLIYT